MRLIKTAHAEEFSNPEAFDVVVAKPYRQNLKAVGIRPMKTKGAIASERFYEIYRAACFKRKKTTKAEAIARHIAALVKLLQHEPDAVVEPILDSLFERINRERNDAAVR
jgi:hypothetical protein